MKADVRNNAELENLLLTMRYWILTEFPRTVIEYILNPLSDGLLDVFLKPLNFEALRLLEKLKRPVTAYTLQVAANNGHVDCLSYCYRGLRSRGNRVALNELNWSVVVQNNHLSCLSFLVKHKVPWTTLLDLSIKPFHEHWSEPFYAKWEVGDIVQFYFQPSNAWVPGTIASVRLLDAYDVLLENDDVAHNIHASNIQIMSSNDSTEHNDAAYESDCDDTSKPDISVDLSTGEYESDYDDNSDFDMCTYDTNSEDDSVQPGAILSERDNCSVSAHTECDYQEDNGDQILEVWSYQLHWSDTTEFASKQANQSDTNHTEGTEISINNIATTSISVDPNYYKEESLNDKDVGNYVEVLDTRTGNWLPGIIIREFGDALNYYDILYENNDIEFDVPFYRLRPISNVHTNSNIYLGGTAAYKLHSGSSYSAPLTAGTYPAESCDNIGITDHVALSACEETKPFPTRASGDADITKASLEKDVAAKEKKSVTRVEFLLFLIVLLLCRITTQL
eukprot:gene7935-9458_t